jgi:polyphosphate kinase 2 (PPK2 family)
MDLAGMTRWSEYGQARDQMLETTHTRHAPWIVVRANDKRRMRLEVIRRILKSVPYAHRDDDAIGKADKKIIGTGPDFLKES